MCVICELKQAASKVFGLEVKEEVIGKVNDDIILKLQMAERNLNDVKEASEAEIKVLHFNKVPKEEAIAILTEKYKDKFNEANQKVNELYDEILTPFNLGRKDVSNGDYKIDPKRGLLIKEYLTESETAQGVH